MLWKMYIGSNEVRKHFKENAHITENKDWHIPASQRPAAGCEHAGGFFSSNGGNTALEEKHQLLRSKSWLPPSLTWDPGGPSSQWTACLLGSSVLENVILA